MTVKKVINEKQKLEQKIYQLLKDFENKTDISIYDIEIDKIEYGNKSELCSFFIEVRI